MGGAAQPAWTLSVATEEGMQKLGASLAGLLEPGDVVSLSGDLGAGKTQFCKGVAAGLGSPARVTSPTFNIMLVYDDGRLPVFHFDLYRLDDEWGLEDVGFYEALEDEGVCLIEWGDRFEGTLPDNRLDMAITVAYPTDPYEGDAPRDVSVTGRGERGFELATRWAEALDADGFPVAAAHGEG